MNYEDAVLARLAHEPTRAGVFGQDGLEQIVRAAYPAGALGLEGPYTAVFDEVELGVAAPAAGVAEGQWGVVGSAERTESHFRLSGLGGAPPPRADVLWRGRIVARVVPPTGEVTRVEVAWPRLGGIDEEIAADAADAGTPVPAGGALEAERRARLLGRVRAGLAHPTHFGEAQMDALLARAGATTVGELMERGPATQPGTVSITFTPTAPAAPAPRPLPVTAALLVRSTPYPLAELLATSRTLREQLRAGGAETPADPEVRPRRSVVVAWVIPDNTFDDVHWPGAPDGAPPNDARAARRAAAAAWLAREGIGLVATP